MSYGGYGSHNDGGDYNQNPRNPYGSPNTYSSPRPYDPPNASNAPYQSAPGTHEMATFNQGNILSECEAIVSKTRQIESDLDNLRALQRQHINNTDISSQSGTKLRVDNSTQSIMDQYRQLADKLREIKQRPESRLPNNQAQVGRAERAIRQTIQRFQEQESTYRNDLKAQMERQIRIVRPNATDAEVRDALQDANSPVFQQAVMQSNRTQQANRVLESVKQRHQEMLKIEQDLIDLMRLLDDMSELLAEQEHRVQAIDEAADEAARDIYKATEELDTAVTTARKTRKKKWICLGICVAIVIIIVVAVVAYIMVNRAANGGGGGGGGNNDNDEDNSDNQKRSLFRRDVLDDLQMNTAHTVEFAGGHPAARGNIADMVARSVNANTAPPMRLTKRRRIDRFGGPSLTRNKDAEAAVKRRFVIDWEGPDSTKSGH
ncbi:hypothetical protein VTK26DRAFT_2032 [Humicola hyalothermophila]